MRLKDRTAIVTGAASGIGRASAELFASEGANVLAVDRPGASLDFESDAIAGFERDLGEDGAPRDIVEAALARFGRLDIVFNNAGVPSVVNAAHMSDEEWDRVQAINLRAVFRLTREAIPSLTASPHGRVISTSSVMALGTNWGHAAYSASKAGLLGLTRNLALELGKQGVTVNAVLPGAIWTGMTDASFKDDRSAEAWAKKAVLKRLGKPIDIARVALFLASDDGGFVTGQAIAADGGIMLRI